MNNKTFYILTGLVLTASVIFWIFMFQQPAADETSLPASFEGTIELTMYHAEGCNCCVKWGEYLERNGVEVTSELVPDLGEVKKEKGVPGRLQSCHTAVADGYVIEGHVPIEDIRRMLGERPDAIGISVPGMPPNSPGMDIPSDRSYQSVLFDEERMAVYNTHEGLVSE